MRLRTIAIMACALAGWSTTAPAQDLCDNPGESCGRLMTQACLNRLGAGSIPISDAQCGDQAKTYRECLAFVASRCSKTAATSTAPDRIDSAGAAAGGFQTLAHTFVEPKGCVIGKSLPAISKLKVRLSQTFCREDGTIFMRFTSFNNGNFNYTTVDLGKPQRCRHDSLTCGFDDSEAGSFSIQFSGQGNDKDGAFLNLILKKK